MQFQKMKIMNLIKNSLIKINTNKILSSTTLEVLELSKIAKIKRVHNTYQRYRLF
jgi:hypothetical protein